MIVKLYFSNVPLTSQLFFVSFPDNNYGITNTSYPPPMDQYHPIDLSRRHSVKTPSVCSDRSWSPTEKASASAYTRPCRRSESRRISSPDFPYFGTEPHRLSASMFEARALQRLRSTISSANESSSDSLKEERDAERDEKIQRPFGAFPKHSENDETSEKYEKFRLEKLKQMEKARGGQLLKSNPKMRRSGVVHANRSGVDSDATGNNSDSSNSRLMDMAYLERRAKNNAAAKKSRDRRKSKEDEIAIRAAFLEEENREYQSNLTAAKNELASLKLELELVRSQLTVCCGIDCTNA